MTMYIAHVWEYMNSLEFFSNYGHVKYYNWCLEKHQTKRKVNITTFKFPSVLDNITNSPRILYSCVGGFKCLIELNYFRSFFENLKVHFMIVTFIHSKLQCYKFPISEKPRAHIDVFSHVT